MTLYSDIIETLVFRGIQGQYEDMYLDICVQGHYSDIIVTVHVLFRDMQGHYSDVIVTL